jgi:hypothetical protein
MNKTREGSWEKTKPGIIVIIIGLVTILAGLGLGNQMVISMGAVVIPVGMLIVVWRHFPMSANTRSLSPGLDILVRHVLMTIPESYKEEFPPFSVFEAGSPCGAHVEEAKVFCDPSLLDMPRDAAVGKLAHEFANLFLKHTGKGGVFDEQEVDALASKWGFTEEIESMRAYRFANK